MIGTRCDSYLLLNWLKKALQELESMEHEFDPEIKDIGPNLFSDDDGISGVPIPIPNPPQHAEAKVQLYNNSGQQQFSGLINTNGYVSGQGEVWQKT
ncbi:hypothetical protein RIF29_18214 [Crotalaria pallida]|uniref:Uncharacterized protein n=1 Tax=Crotalaria pallida TaxID=3830 RepID=A0AAN9FPH1_CROPI